MEDTGQSFNDPQSSRKFSELVEKIFESEELGPKEAKLKKELEKFKGQTVIDLGAGNEKSIRTYKSLEKIGGVNLYIGVEKNYENSERLKESLDKQNLNLSWMVTNQGMKEFLSLQEENSYSIIMSGIDNNVFTGVGGITDPIPEYIKNLNEEIIRVLDPEGVAIMVDSVVDGKSLNYENNKEYSQPSREDIRDKIPKYNDKVVFNYDTEPITKVRILSKSPIYQPTKEENSKLQKQLGP